MSAPTMAHSGARRDSARVSTVAAAFALELGFTAGSCHQHLQRVRRELPALVRTAFRLGRHQWVDWFFAETDATRMAVGTMHFDEGFLLAKGAVDRTEDGAREAYLLASDDQHARELDARLEKEQLAIARARSGLRVKHPRAFA